MPELKNGRVPRVLATEYASYRDNVTNRLCKELRRAEHPRSHRLVLYDPMAGTAPLLPVAEQHGYTAYFNDLNPLHRYVNGAKSFPAFLAFKRIGEAELLATVCEMASGLDRCPRTPTDKWIEGRVLDTLALAWQRSDDQPASTATLTKAVLLLSLRHFSSSIKTENPTWLRPGGLRPKIAPRQGFLSAVQRLDAFYRAAYAEPSAIKGGCVFFTDYDASRSRPKRKVDVVMTSPPFCNRVDWDRLYAPEHFFLSAVGEWHTKVEFLGTTTVRGYCDFEADLTFVTERSGFLRSFLKKVRQRQLRRERGSDYYVKYFTRYFAGLFRVFDMAIHSLRARNAGIYFVVQDNRHRGLSVDIGQALGESLSSRGFRVRDVKGWDRRHMGLRNISKRYRVANPKQREQICHAIR